MAMQLPKKPVIPMNKIQTYSKAHDTMFIVFDSLELITFGAIDF